MRRVTLLYNPASGTRQPHRLRSLRAAAEVFETHGVAAELVPTTARGSGGDQARAAVAAGSDTIFACGGDGTVHDVLQGIAFDPAATLGVLPLGSANVLARHLGLALDARAAALQQLSFEARTVALGKVTCTTPAGPASRYFLVMAGAGPDGALVYNMLAVGKHRFGRLAYYARAALLFAAHRFTPFTVTVQAAGVGAAEQRDAVSAMAVRISDLGGLFSPLVRGTGLEQPKVMLALAQPPAWLSLPGWFGMSWLGLHKLNPLVSTQAVTAFSCGEGKHHPVQVQADGEWLGRTPMHVEFIPNALRLLVPPVNANRSAH